MKFLRERVPGPAVISRLPWRLVLFAVFGLGSFWYGFLAHPAAEAGDLLQSCGYYAMAVTSCWWAWSLYRLVAQSPKKISVDLVTRHRAAVGLAVGLTLVGCLTMPYSYKVLYDEIVLQTTAWSLHHFREFCTMWRGHMVEGVFQSLGVYVDKRPFFYPFVVSLVHDLAGYRLANAFWVNTLLMPAALGLLYAILGRFGGAWPRWTAFTCFGTSVLLAQNANGSGMEMLNLFMFLLTLALALHYLAEPKEDRLAALVLSCILLAQTRYESALYVAPVAIVIAEGWRRAQRIILPPAAVCAPLLLIPCALHNTYLAGTPSLWELREDVPYRFEAKYLGGNIEHAITYFFDFSGHLMSSWWLSVVGLWALGCVCLVLLHFRWRWKTAAPEALVAVLFGLAVVANLGLLMFYFWGQLDDPIVARLILPFTVMMALAIAWCVEHMPAGWREKAAKAFIAGAVFTYLGFGTRAITYNRTINQLASEITWEEQWLARQPRATRLIITNKTVLNWLDNSIPALSIADARNKAERVQFHLNAGTFQEVLVSQFYRPVNADGGFVLDPRDELPPAYELTPVIERQIGGRLLRISRVASIHLPLKKESAEAVSLDASRIIAGTTSKLR